MTKHQKFAYYLFLSLTIILSIAVVELNHINNLVRHQNEMDAAQRKAEVEGYKNQLNNVQEDLKKSNGEVKALKKQVSNRGVSSPSFGSTRYALVTGFNSVPEQTDATPCQAAGGYICGRTDVVACPPDLSLGTWVQIDGKSYQCLDRTAPKFSSRFDIFCDKDFTCPDKVFGTKKILVMR